MNPQDNNSEQNNKSWLFSRTGLVTCGFLAAIAFLMATGHTAHLLGFLPYALFLLCPLMHIFMHGGHGGHSHHGDNDDKETKSHDDKKGGCH
jgi:hypothetical protein